MMFGRDGLALGGRVIFMNLLSNERYVFLLLWSSRPVIVSLSVTAKERSSDKG